MQKIVFLQNSRNSCWNLEEAKFPGILGSQKGIPGGPAMDQTRPDSGGLLLFIVLCCQTAK